MCKCLFIALDESFNNGAIENVTMKGSKAKHIYIGIYDICTVIECLIINI